MNHPLRVISLAAAAAAALGLATTATAGDLAVSGKLVSTVGSGPPLQVSSATRVPQLNADRVDGLGSADLAAELGNVVTVGTSGGVTSLDAAFAAITDSSPSNPYLIRIGPGEYSCTLCDAPPDVAIAGAGIGASRILLARRLRIAGISSLREMTLELVDDHLGAGSPAALDVADHAELTARSIEISSTMTFLGIPRGLMVNPQGHADLEDVRVYLASPSPQLIGLNLLGSARLRRVDVEVAGAGERAAGINSSDVLSGESVTIRVAVTGSATATGLSLVHGTHSDFAHLIDSRITVEVDTNNGFGIATTGASRFDRVAIDSPTAILLSNTVGTLPTTELVIAHSRLDGPISAGNGADAGTQVLLDHVQVASPGKAPIFNSSAGAIRVLHSTLEGDAVSNTGGGSILCRFTTDENLTAFSSTCP